MSAANKQLVIITYISNHSNTQPVVSSLTKWFLPMSCQFLFLFSFPTVACYNHKIAKM